MARLNLSLFGSFQALLGGQPLREFESVKARALLAYLAVESDRAHSREALADLLWPGYAPTAARTNLRNTLSNLRALLRESEQSPPFLLVTSEAIRFNRASDAQVDALDFEALLAGEREMRRLERAASLYQGDFLDGLALKDSSVFEDWLMLVRERLRRQYLEALRQLTGGHRERGERELALEDARRWAEADPWDEGAQRALMQLLAASGQRGAALAQYERCKQALASQLGVEPEAATTALYQEIRDGGPRAVEAESRARGLPTPLLPLIGRERELEDLLRLLREPSCRLLTILGPGGAGKTRLALEAARQLQGELARGAQLIPLSAVGAEGLVAAIAHGIGLSFYAKTPPRQQLLDYLRDKERLLLLDSCEHLLAEGGLFSEILEAAPQVKILATTRARLGLLGEQCMVLGGLEYAAAAPSEALTPNPSPKGGGESDLLPLPLGEGRGEDLPLPLGEGLVNAEGLDDGYPAMQLFIEGARRVRPGYAPRAEDRAAIAQLCRWVEGMPLAILLASAWMEMLSPGEIVAQMAGADGQHLDLLAADYQDLPERQRSMRAMFDHSWNLLSAREQEIVAALSVFRGGFSAEAAREVAGASLRDLLRLADRSMLLRARIEGRYGLHDLLRQYAAEKLAAAGQEMAARDSHARYYAQTLGGRWREELRNARQPEALREIASRLTELRAACEWAAKRAQAAWLDPALDALGTFYNLEAQPEEAERQFARIMDKLPAASIEGALLRIRSKALRWRSGFTYALEGTGFHTGDPEAHARSVQLARESLRCAEEAAHAGEDTRLEQAAALRRLATSTLRTRHEEREALYRRGLALALEAEDDEEVASSEVTFAEFLRYLGRMEEGRPLIEHALALRRQMGGPRGINNCLFTLWWWAWQAVCVDEMEALANELAAMDTSELDRAALATHHDQVGRMFYGLGRWAEAHAALQREHAIWRELGARWQIAESRGIMAACECHLGLYAQARADAEELLRLGQELGHWLAVMNAHEALSWAALGEGRDEEAERYARLELKQREDAHHMDCLEPLLVLALVEIRRGEAAEAREHIRRSLLILRDIPLRAGAIRNVLPQAALYWAATGREERALEIYGLALTFRWAVTSRWIEDVAGREIKARAAMLPPKRAAAPMTR